MRLAEEAISEPLGNDVPRDLDEASLLDRYLASIRSIPVLSREQTWALSRRMDEAEAAFRQALAAVPGTAMRVVERWEERCARGLVTAALHARYRDASGTDWSRTVDASVGRVRALLEKRAEIEAAGRSTAETDVELARWLGRAEIGIEVLREIHAELSAWVGPPHTRPRRETRRRLGLAAPAARARLQEAAEALERLDHAKHTLVRHNLKLVVSSAKRYRRMGIPFLDLIQEGTLGLVRAAEKFDHGRGFTFATYAVWWIQQSLIRAVQQQSRTIRVPSHVYERQVRLRRAEAELRRRHGREPRRDEMARALDLSLEDLDRTLVSGWPVASTEEPLGEGEGRTLADVLEDESTRDPGEGLDRITVDHAVHAALTVLGPRERHVIERRFGLGDGEPRTLKEIGTEMGLSRERVRQIQQRALGRLRERDAGGRLAALMEAAGDEG